MSYTTFSPKYTNMTNKKINRIKIKVVANKPLQKPNDIIQANVNNAKIPKTVILSN